LGLAKPFPAKCKPFCAICKPSYLGFSEEICKTFQEPALSHHANYAPHNPDSNLWGHHFGRVQVRSWFARFGRFARRLPPDELSEQHFHSVLDRLEIIKEARSEVRYYPAVKLGHADYAGCQTVHSTPFRVRSPQVTGRATVKARMVTLFG